MNIYESPHYKKLLIAPAILLVLALLALPGMKAGVDLRGGIAITGPAKAVDADSLAREMSAGFGIAGVSVKTTASPSGQGIFIEFTGNRELLAAAAELEAKNYEKAIGISKQFTGELNITGEPADQASAYFSKAREKFKNDLITFISAKTGTPEKDFSIRDVGPALGEFFWSQGRTAIIMAFILVSILVFLFFRIFVPSVAVIQAMFFDVLVAAGAMAFFGIPLSLPTIAALLMIIGYSVDTDILLTTRALRSREGTVQQRMWASLKTGLTMTLAAIASVLSIYLVSAAVGMEALSQISAVLFFGLFADIFATWCSNAAIVQWYLLKGGKK